MVGGLATVKILVFVTMFVQELTRANREEKLRQQRCKSPALAHMKLHNTLARHNSLDRMSQTSSSIPPSPLLRKSNLNKGNTHIYYYFRYSLFWTRLLSHFPLTLFWKTKLKSQVTDASGASRFPSNAIGRLTQWTEPEKVRVRCLRPSSDAVLHMSRIEFVFRPT